MSLWMDHLQQNHAMSIIAVGMMSTLCLLWHRRLRSYLESIKPFPNLPMPPGNHFLWGHLLWFMRVDFQTSHQAALDHGDEHGRIGFWILRTPSMFVSHWQDARTVLLQTDSRHVVALAKYHLTQSFGGRNIALLQGREWKVHRNAMIKSLLAPSNILRQQRAIQRVTRTMAQSLHAKLDACSTTTTTTTTTTGLDMVVTDDGSLQLDVLPLMKMITLDVFGQSVLNTDFECCPQLALSPVAQALDVLGSELTRRISQPTNLANVLYRLPTPQNQRFAQSRRLVRTFVSQLILQQQQQQQEKKMLSSTDAGQEGDMIRLLLQQHAELNHEDNGPAKGENVAAALAEQTLGDLLLGLVFAGYETTSICLTYALYLLAAHPKDQEHCFQEALRVASTTADQRSLDVEALVYCEAVILESLRLYPPVFGINRKVEKNIALHDGFVIPAGTNVIFPFWTMQRMEQNFACPNEFRPDRWVEPEQQPQPKSSGGGSSGVVWVHRSQEDHDNGATPIPPANRQALVAFSAGSRSCAGQRFAMQEAILVLAGLIQEFQVHLIDPAYKVHAVRHGMVQIPKGGLPLRLTPRTKVSSRQ